MTTSTRFQDVRGNPVRLTFPDLAAMGIEAPALAVAIGRHRGLTADLAAAQAEHGRLLAARDQALQAGADARAQAALAAGDRDRAKAMARADAEALRLLAAHDQAVAAQARQVTAYQDAVAMATDAVVIALEDARSTVLGDVDTLVAEATTAMAAALDAWAEARARRQDLLALRRWATKFPDDLRYQAGTAGRVAGLPALNHDDYAADAVLAALRRDAGSA